MRKAALLLFLFLGFTSAAQVTVYNSNSHINFKAESDTNILLSLDKSLFLTAQNITTQITQNTFETKLNETFANAEIDSMYKFDNSYFVTGLLANKFPFEIGFFFDEKISHKYWISVKVEDEEANLSTLQIRFKTDANHFWGGGIQNSIFDFKGKEFIGNDTSAPTQFFIPKFCSEKDFCFEIKPVECNVKFNNSGLIETTVSPYRKDNYWLFNIEFNKSEKQAEKQLNILPDWALGTIIKTDIKQLKKQTNNILKQKQKGSPISAVLITKFSVLNTQNSFLNKAIKQLNHAGLKVLCNFSPLIEIQNELQHHLTLQQYLVQDSIGQPYKILIENETYYMVNLFKPEAAAWYKQVIKTKLLQMGYSGWIANNSNYFPFNAQIPEGFTPQSAHHFYSVIWARINQEVLKENNLYDSCLVFHTNGSAGIERYAKAYAANLSSTKNTVQYFTNPLLSSAISGLEPLLLYSYSPKNDYLNILQSFIPFYCVNYSSLKNSTLKFSIIHYLLKDYFQENIKNGSIVKPLTSLFYQEIDSNYKYEFLVGNDLLIAPHINDNSTKTSVKFPEGNWRYIFDSTTPIFYTNQIADIEFKNNTPAIFVRIGSSLDSVLNNNKTLFLK